MNRAAVTPTFQSARVAGWKTGATKLHGFMVPMHAKNRKGALHERGSFHHSKLADRFANSRRRGRAVTPNQVLAGLRNYFTKTARADGSFANGIDPQYRGMSDSAYSDLAAVTYAVTLYKTFGWKLPHEEATRRFLLMARLRTLTVAREQGMIAFFNGKFLEKEQIAISLDDRGLVGTQKCQVPARERESALSRPCNSG